jgi:hypothetical protein
MQPRTESQYVIPIQPVAIVARQLAFVLVHPQIAGVLHHREVVPDGRTEPGLHLIVIGRLGREQIKTIPQTPVPKAIVFKLWCLNFRPLVTDHESRQRRFDFLKTIRANTFWEISNRAPIW